MTIISWTANTRIAIISTFPNYREHVPNPEDLRLFWLEPAKSSPEDPQTRRESLPLQSSNDRKGISSAFGIIGSRKTIRLARAATKPARQTFFHLTKRKGMLRYVFTKGRSHRHQKRYIILHRRGNFYPRDAICRIYKVNARVSELGKALSVTALLASRDRTLTGRPFSALTQKENSLIYN